jgi:ABC-2 type transport system permease protein
MLALVTNSYGNAAYSVFIERFHRSLEELLSAPLSDHQIMWGFIAGGVFRGMSCAFIVWITTYFFLGYTMVYPLFFLVACLVSSTVFSLMGVINGLVARTFDDLNVMTIFLLNPLVMLGGVFYSVTMLSEFWQNVAWLNPLLYVGNLFRFCMIGVSNIDPTWVMVVLVALIFILYSVAFWIMTSTTYVRQ